MGFEWDAGKAGINARKHGVDFADAATAVEDEAALTQSDDGSETEERWITLGLSATGRLLVVVWTWRETRVRLISARAATRAEHRQYQERI